MPLRCTFLKTNCINTFFCPKQAKSVSFQLDKTDYVLYLLTFDATDTWKEG